MSISNFSKRVVGLGETDFPRDNCGLKKLGRLTRRCPNNVFMRNSQGLLHETLLAIDDVETRSCNLVQATTAEVIDALHLRSVDNNT